MSEHVVPQSHLELLQAIYKALVLQADPEATFVKPKANRTKEKQE